MFQLEQPTELELKENYISPEKEQELVESIIKYFSFRLQH